MCDQESTITSTHWHLYKIFVGSEVIDMEGYWKAKDDIHVCNKISNYGLECDGELIYILMYNKLNMSTHKITGKYDGKNQINWSKGEKWIKHGII